jgi:hypothetical protein
MKKKVGPCVGLLVISMLLLSGCGGGGGGTPQASPTTSGLLPTPATTPVISGDLFEYPERGYSVQIPQGWTAEPNFVASPSVQIDVFFGPLEGSVQPNISVACQPLPQGTTAEKYFQDKMDLIRALAGTEVEAQPVQVSGVDARRATYTSPGQAQAGLDKVEVYFINAHCGWSIALVVPQGQAATYDPVLDAFIGSFKLLPAP